MGDKSISENDILPCKKCGGKAHSRYRIGMFIVICTKCEARGEHWGNYPNEAIIGWNLGNAPTNPMYEAVMAQIEKDK